MKIPIEMGDRDLEYFRERLQVVLSGDHANDERVVLAAATKLVNMLEDAEWRPEGDDLRRVLEMLAYFVDPDDLIPDRIPGLRSRS